MAMARAMTLHVSGWKSCPFYQKTANAVVAMEHLYPLLIKADIHEHDDRDAFRRWLSEYKHPDNDLILREHLGSRAITHTSSPFVWKNGNEFIGGCDDTFAFLRTNFMSTSTNPKEEAFHSNDTDVVINPENQSFDYDLVVIGGGSGGLAMSKEAAKFGAKVAVLDYVKPSPIGTTWGLGGTCVNVGCIPKKLMHQSAIIGSLMEKDAASFGWSFGAQKPTFKWSEAVQSVQDYIHSLNFKYRVDLRSKKVKYENMLGKFVDAHTLECTNPKKGKVKKITARRFAIAVGGRPRPLSCPGAELAISSDDIFQYDHAPGKTLVVGASYVALECAGFLHGMGFPVTILVRSILLRGFDQDMAERIGKYMEEEEKIKFNRGCVPTELKKTSEGQILVTWKNNETGVEESDVFDTVLNATGRIADLKNLGLDSVGVNVNPKSGKILSDNEQTNVPHIYAIGDVLDDKPELTPVAIQAGRLLARRLYNGSSTPMNYEKIPTAVFTPLEYGCCGLSEEDAKAKLGEDNVEVYHQSFNPLEWSLSHERTPDAGYMKLICDKSSNNLVVGFHYLGPNSGEITQAVGLAMKMDSTYEDFMDTVGIHPTTAEVFTTMEITKSSGEDASAGGC